MMSGHEKQRRMPREKGASQFSMPAAEHLHKGQAEALIHSRYAHYEKTTPDRKTQTFTPVSLVFANVLCLLFGSISPFLVAL